MLNTARRGLQLIKIGWGLRQAGQAHSEAEKLLAQRALTALFAEARGVTMKIGQLFGDKTDDTPFRDLLDNIEPLPLSAILPEIDRALGRPHQEVFATIEEASAAASLGQVHHATLHDGTEVAVKVRYPDIAAAVKSELKLAGLMPGMGPVKKWGFDLEAYKQNLKQNMDRELDYLSEAERQQRFAQAVQVPGLVVPPIYNEWCRNNLLVQGWENGEDLAVVQHWPPEERQRVATILLATVFKSLFEGGEVHGDPHLGNYFFRRSPEPQVVLMDFGCTIPVSRQQGLALLKLILAVREGRDVTPLQAFAAMGFDAQKLSYISGALPTLSNILLYPFKVNEAIFMNQWVVRSYMESLLGDQRWWFRSAGPAELLLLMRVFQGLARQLDTIKARVNWWQVLESTLSPLTLESARDLSLPDPGISTALNPVNSLASELRVEVLKDNRPHVAVTLPAMAALDLQGIMPEDVWEELQQSDEVDIKAVQTQLQQQGVAPQTLFELTRGDKHYKVWLK